MTREEFEDVVAEALATIPAPFRARMRNIAVEVRDRPSAKQLRESQVPPNELLLGLYQGVPLPERNAGFGDPLFPDRVFLFQECIEQVCRSRAELIEEIRETVIHEVGHYFGLSDDEMDE